MMESKVFADNFSRSFSESGDFFQFLSARQARSKWMTAPSKELRFEPVERGSTLGNLYMQIYDHNGDADVLEDTMENTSLLLKVDGKDYPVRSCASTKSIVLSRPFWSVPASPVMPSTKSPKAYSLRFSTTAWALPPATA